MTLNKVSEKIILSTQNGGLLSPFLFVGQNLEILNSEIKNLAFSLFEKFDIPKANFFILEDIGEKIKIEEIKKFSSKSNISTPYEFQIFLIENISRMTLQSFNSCLKFFEEPGKKNIIFLTNASESGLLDTILSRVQTINLFSKPIFKKDEFYYNLISESISEKKGQLLSYVFRNKLEKEDMVKILENIIIYSKDNLVFIDILDKLQSDINAIQQNNVNARGVLDKWVLNLVDNK